ncbi:MAG: hypothetical protein OEP95_04100 [Myxococcales bacterium]|nr:hypothetical protein [Myxococcales bacterium]
MRSRFALACLLVLQVGTGCAVVDMPGVTCKLVKEKPQGGGPLVYQVRFTGKGNAPQRFAVMWAPYAVYERFTGSVHWTIDPERLEESNGGRACLELDDLTDDTRALESYVNLCGDYFAPSTGNEGVQYRVDVNGSVGAPVFVPGARAMGFRAEWDGATLNLFRVDAGVATLVDAVAYANAGATHVATGVTQFPKKGVFLLDDFSAEDMGPLPAGATAEQQVAHTIGYGLHHLYQAGSALNGPTTDWMLAGTELAAADAVLVTAETELGAVADESVRKKGGKKLAKARKQLAKAQAKTAAQKQKPAVSKLGKAIKAATDAWLLATPFLLTES